MPIEAQGLGDSHSRPTQGPVERAVPRGQVRHRGGPRQPGNSGGKVRHGCAQSGNDEGHPQPDERSGEEHGGHASASWAPRIRAGRVLRVIECIHHSAAPKKPRVAASTTCPRTVA